MEKNDTSDSKERERVHIFLPEDDKNDIDEAAGKYHSDNRSGFLRVAASFYTEFLRNGLTTDLKKLRQDVVEILERIKEIESILKEISDQIKDNAREVPDKHIMSSDSNSSRQAMDILEVLNGADEDWMSERRLFNRGTLQLKEYSHALEKLEDNGMIEKRVTQDGQHQYKISK